MQIYLPLAETSLNIVFLLEMALWIGFLSGLFGIGGAFLTTPLLIFVGVPSDIAVASGTAPIAAYSVASSGGYWRLRSVDVRLTGLLIVGGAIGTAYGVWLFAFLQNTGQLVSTIEISYALVLGVMNIWLLVDTLVAALRGQYGRQKELSTPGNGTWGASASRTPGLARFPIYVVGLPAAAIGFAMGFIGALLGINIAFVLIPILIYVLRLPFSAARGTIVAFTSVTMALATVMHAAGNARVDIVLAMCLIASGVVGAALGAKVGQRMRGEQLRVLLALVVSLLLLGLVNHLISAPADLFAIGQPGFASE